MRVITGTARGRKLLEPSGMDIRPTADVVKEAVFNIIQFDIEGRRVLDLFAGTGQLGIEALSRGAAECVFVDEGAKAVKLVRENSPAASCRAVSCRRMPSRACLVGKNTILSSSTRLMTRLCLTNASK